jgi:hypothetical protein
LGEQKSAPRFYFCSNSLTFLCPRCQGGFSKRRREETLDSGEGVKNSGQKRLSKVSRWIL